jgi:hypothetical protein
MAALWDVPRSEWSYDDAADHQKQVSAPVA